MKSALNFGMTTRAAKDGGSRAGARLMTAAFSGLTIQRSSAFRWAYGLTITLRRKLTSLIRFSLPKHDNSSESDVSGVPIAARPILGGRLRNAKRSSPQERPCHASGYDSHTAL